MTAGRRFDQVRLAVMMLTRLPVGRLRDPAPTPAEACWAYPLAGVPVALVGWGVLTGAVGMGLAPIVAAMLAMLGVVLVTGAIHHDGLADFVDGIGGGRDRARRLEIMRDSRIGSYGVVALILAMGLQVGAMTAFAPPLGAFVTVAVASRLAMVAVLVMLPPARNDGLGSASSCRTPFVLLPGGLILLGMAVFLGPWATVPVLVAMAIVAGIVARIAMLRIGGQTGDVLGAVQLSAETAGWIGLSAMF